MRQDNTSELIGGSPAICELREEIARVAGSDIKVLITGESGTGKELVAQAVHNGSARARRPWVALNCAGLPDTLLESELFGHVKGSFTGAYKDTPGKLQLAHGGTIFLDEIGETSLRMQGLLLRFLETGELQRVGSDRGREHVDVRVITATNRDLRALIAQGLFREDLFYRLNVIHLVVPPLRERRGDIPVLLDHFLGRCQGRNGGRGKELTREALSLLTEYSWPGNVRELQNVVERLVFSSRAELIGPEDLPLEVRTYRQAAVRPRRERRRTVADELFVRLVDHGESFWTSVYPLYIQREITRGNLRDLVGKGLEEARGNYKIVARIFNMEPGEYKRFVNFLRKHDCQLPFKPFRQPRNAVESRQQ